MDLGIKKLEEVWTKDEKMLGLTQGLFHRLEGINPKLQFYGSYLEVESYEYGASYFVPTDFIAPREPDSARIMLTVTLRDVMEHTWFVMPDFIVHGQARREALV